MEGSYEIDQNTETVIDCDMRCRESMKNDSGNQAYANMMVDSLRKKREILKTLLALSQEQESMLKGEMDVDRFEETVREKGRWIDELNKLDSGFDSLFKKLETELTGHQGAYETEITGMKSLIQDITELSNGIQVLEKKNYDQFQVYELVLDDGIKKRLVTQHLMEILDLFSESLDLSLELLALKSCETSESHVDDLLCLLVGKAEPLAHTCLGFDFRS